MWLIVPAGWVTADDDVRVAFSGAMVLVGPEGFEPPTKGL